MTAIPAEVSVLLTVENINYSQNYKMAKLLKYHNYKTNILQILSLYVIRTFS